MTCKCFEYSSRPYPALMGMHTLQLKEEGKRVPEHLDLTFRQECFCIICTQCPNHGTIK